VFCEESYSAFPIWLSFITKLNSNKLNIKKIIPKKIILKKKYYKKKENTKEIGKKSCEEKLYQSIVFCKESYSVFPTWFSITCNCNSQPA
jgi:hypothetical protein